MREHDSTRPDFEYADPNRRTPLNDELTFAMECRAAKDVFKGFEWSRDQADNWQDEVAGEYQPSSSDEEEQDGQAVHSEGIEGEGDGMTLNWSVSEQLEGSQELELDMPALPGLGAQNFDSEPGFSRTASAESIAPELDPRSPTPIIDGPVDSPGMAPVTEVPIEHPPPSEIPQQEAAPSPTIEVTSPPVSPSVSISREAMAPSSPQAIKVPSPRQKTKLRLPSGLPASGLSSSEIISIPSPDPNSPTRLVRRHPVGFDHTSKPSVDTVHTLHLANHRLSVDLHGTISNLGDEDWEKLETETGHTNIPSLSNAAPVAFFTRGFGTLRRRPSAINTGGGGGGGFRRQHKTSQSSNSQSGDSSPTKANRHRPIFNVKSIENTKKAFKTLKAFPRMISRSKDHPGQTPIPTPTPTPTPTQTKSSAPSRVTTPTSPPAKNNGASVPNTATASWFNTRRMGLSKSFAKPKPGPARSTTPSSASTGSSSHTFANETNRTVRGNTGLKDRSTSQSQEVPRVELTHSPPVNWDLGSEGMKGQGAVEQTEKETEGKAASGDLEEDRKVGEFKEEKTMGEKGEDGILAGITSKES
jgi:hypothetical protein